MEWQTIDTAPKGAWVMLYHSSRFEPDCTHWIAIFRHHEYGEDWVDQNDWIVVHRPTHWMPLPAAPEVSA